MVKGIFTQKKCYLGLIQAQILCCHPNGYIRHAAIKKLVKQDIRSAIPILLIRANDWVDDIKSLCQRILRLAISTDDIRHIVDYLPLLVQLKIKGRYDQFSLVKDIESDLITKCYNQLLEKTKSGNTKIRRYAFNLIANNSSNIKELLNNTISHHDIIIRLRAIKMAQKYYSSKELLIYLEMIKNDKLMVVRRNALLLYVKNYLKQSQQVLEEALFDKSKPIRGLSRYYLKSMGINEFSHYYRNALIKNCEAIKTAILGLGETGSSNDYQYILPQKSKIDPSINAAIISATFKLKPNNWKEMIASNLELKDSAYLKSLTCGIIQNQDYFSFDEICTLLYNRENILFIKHFLKVLAKTHKNKWTILDFLLNKLLETPEQKATDQIKQYLIIWINRNSPCKVFTKTTSGISTACMEKTDILCAQHPDDLVYKELLGNIKLFI